jgi:hypothetical protein
MVISSVIIITKTHRINSLKGAEFPIDLPEIIVYDIGAAIIGYVIALVAIPTFCCNGW